MNTEAIGSWAGLVWNALNETETVGLKQLKKITKLKDKELFARSRPVKAVGRVTALHIDAESLALAVGAALVGMAGDAVFVAPHKYSVVVGGVLIDEPRPDKGTEDLPVYFSGPHQVTIDPTHRPGLLRQCEGLWLLCRFR